MKNSYNCCKVTWIRIVLNLLKLFNYFFMKLIIGPDQFPVDANLIFLQKVIYDEI